MMIMLIVLTGFRGTSQAFLSVLYTCCLIGLFLTVVLVWKARYMINQKWSKTHAHFSTAVASKCIVDKGWRNVLELFNKHTDFGTTAKYLTYMIYVYVGLLVVGV